MFHDHKNVCVLFRSENITLTTLTSVSDVTVNGDYISGQATTNYSTWTTTGATGFQQVQSTLLIEDNSTTSSRQYYLHPDVLVDVDGLDNVDVGFYVDSINSTQRYDADNYLDIDDDAQRARDLERIVVEPPVTSQINRVTSSASRDMMSTSVSSPPSTVDGPQPQTSVYFGTTAIETGRRQSSSVGTTIQTATTTRNSAEDDDDEDWWQHLPFIDTPSTTQTTTSSVDSLIAAATGVSTTTAVDASFSSTMTSTSLQTSRITRDHLDTKSTTTQTSSTWMFSPATSAQRTTKSSYTQYGYIDLEELDDVKVDVAVRQSSTDDGPTTTEFGQVTTSTRIVLVISIVVASLLLLAVVILLVFYRHDRAFPASVSTESFPAGCRRYLAVCGLGPPAVTRPATETTPTPRTVAPTEADHCRTISKSHGLPPGTVVVTSAQIKHSRAVNNQGVIEWYV